MNSPSILGIPVVTTLMGIGAIDTTDPLSMRMLGMHGAAFANYAVEDCDFLIAFGARFDDRVAGNPAEVRAAREEHRAVRHRLGGDQQGQAGAVDPCRGPQGLAAQPDRLRPQHAALRPASRTLHPGGPKLADLRRNHAMNYDRESALVQPYFVLEEINRITGGEAIISTGVGQHQMWAAQYLDFREPRLWLTSGSMGTMGFGLPAAIGAQVANPGRLVIDIDGDASIRMNIGELETVTTYDLPVKVCVLNNIGDGMVRQWQKLFFGGRMASTDKSLHKKDFIKAAQADGFLYAERLSNNADVTRVVREWLEFKGPAFLEVMIDPDAGVYPMVGPGLGYDSMITGDFIPARKKPAAVAPAKPGASEMF